MSCVSPCPLDIARKELTFCLICCIVSRCDLSIEISRVVKILLTENVLIYISPGNYPSLKTNYPDVMHDEFQGLSY